MANSTPRLGLYQPENGENINVTTDLNNNLSLLDTNINFRVVANETAREAIAEAEVYEGLSVRETDTGRCFISNGSSPASGSWEEVLMVTGSGIVLGDGVAISKTASSSVDDILTSTMVGNTDPLFSIETSGRLSWGSGASGQELHLYRSTTDTLRLLGSLVVDDSLTVGSATVTGDATISGDLTVSGATSLSGQSMSTGNGGNTTSTTYGSLTGGDVVSVTVTTGTSALICAGARAWNDGVHEKAWVSFDVTGATTLPADDVRAFCSEGNSETQGTYTFLYTALTPGSNTFTLRYRSAGGTAEFDNMHLSVIPM